MVGMIANISDRKDTIFISNNNNLIAEIQIYWQIKAFFWLYR